MKAVNGLEMGQIQKHYPSSTGRKGCVSPRMVTIREEDFACNRANGMGLADAYLALKTGTQSRKTAKSAAINMQKRPTVKARITEIIQQRADMLNKAAVKAIARAAVDKEWVLRELVKNVRRAKVAKKFDAVNRSLELIGKELAMFIDRKEIRTGPLTNLTDEQLIELTAALDAGLPPGSLGVFGQAGNSPEDQGKPAEVLPALH